MDKTQIAAQHGPVTAHEPVAWFWRDKEKGTVGLQFSVPAWVDDVNQGQYELTPLYAAQPAASATRADFEACFHLCSRQKWRHKDGTYVFGDIQAKWEGWEAKERTDVAQAQLAGQMLPVAIRACFDGRWFYGPWVAGTKITPEWELLYTAPPASSYYRDAYEGAREDLLDWKRRALEAEAKLRNGAPVMRTEPKGE